MPGNINIPSVNSQVPSQPVHLCSLVKVFSFSGGQWLHIKESSGLVSSPEHEVLMVSYCGQSMSVVRRASCVVRRAASTIALKAYSSCTPGPIDLILGRKHQGDL